MEGQEIHLDHADGGGPDDYNGWAHAHCNTSAGAARGNQLRGRRNGAVARPAPLARLPAPRQCEFHDPPLSHCPHSRAW